MGLITIIRKHILRKFKTRQVGNIPRGIKVSKREEIEKLERKKKNWPGLVDLSVMHDTSFKWSLFNSRICLFKEDQDM